MPRILPKSPSYEAELSALLRMHRLSVAGKEESEEADLVRESAYDYWDDLSKAQRDRLTGLSKDLYEVSDGLVQAPEPMNPQAQAKLVEAYEARERGDWDKALELLRRWGKHVPTAVVSYLRGAIWRSAGEPATAAVFFEHAAQLDPDNENYQATLLHTLKTADPAAAAIRASAVLDSSETQPPAVVVHAADVIFGSARSLSEIDSLPIYQRLIPILEGTLARMKDREDVDKPALTGMVLRLLAASYKNIGDTRNAYACYSRAIQLDPMNDALLVARGILRYGADAGAAADFEQAVRLDSSLVWPYFYLAHHYLENNRLEECRAMCERALQKTSPARVRSQLYEFLAISLAGLGYPEQAVRQGFENAIRADPSNERATRNMESFETAMATRAMPAKWERISGSSMRKLGQQETRLDPVACDNQKPVPA